MEEQMILDKLIRFGLTRQEAQIYLCLYQNGAMTGYEVAKTTGISRSNVYNGLSDLADKGAAYLEEGNVNRYVAVACEEFCSNKLRSLHADGDYLIRNIPMMKQTETGYLTIQGSQNIRNKLIGMLESVEKRVYFSAKAEYVDEFAEYLEKLIPARCKIVIITDGELSSELLRKNAVLYRGEAKGDTVHLIVDSEYALTGQLTGGREDTCLYTGQTNFINVFKEMLRNEMRLIELNKEKGKQTGA